MATKGGGLLGGADAQLVQGAFRAEKKVHLNTCRH